MAAIMHKGGESATALQLTTLPTPRPMGPSHYPIPHHDFARLVTDGLEHMNFDVLETRYYLARNAAQMFGLARVRTSGRFDDHTFEPLVGFRNSHDMSCAAGVAMGMRVLVCDNMSFSGEVVIHRKHTLNIMNDLPDLILGALGKLTTIHEAQESRVEAYRGTPCASPRAAELVLEAHAMKLISPGHVKDVWRDFVTDPLEHDVSFDKPSYWRLYNCITGHWKTSPAQLMGPIHNKSLLLHELLDEEISHA